ncbi:MAG: pyrroline-5-carboxylate reductase [Proteobacteria bacterium]|nr:pyrroline-5-carboxylate reductase [Pseudomonadota bacterium]
MQRISGDVCLFGAGVIATSLGAALLESKVVSKGALWGMCKSARSARQASKELGISVYTEDFSARLRRTEAIVIAVKPAQVRAALRQLRSQGLSPKTLVISVATGVPIAAFLEELGPKALVARAATNTPIRVRKGMTALCFGENVSARYRKVTEQIFSTVGRCIEIEERHCEVMTALAGSGPAYFFTLMEALADGGLKMGVPRSVAFEVIAQTMLGAAQMALSTQRHPALLRDEVTTPGGCTIAALMVMEEGKLRAVLSRAVMEATRVARELGKK